MTIEQKFKEYLRGTMFPAKPAAKDGKLAAVSLLRHKKASEWASKIKAK